MEIPKPNFVYLLICLVNDKWYVGKTSKTVHRRWSDHKSDARTGRDYLLGKAIRKHGEENFEVQTIACVRTGEEASNLEKIWILLLESYNPDKGYNLTFGGEGMPANEETKRKISQTHKKIGTKPPSTKGFKFPSEYGKRISERNKGQKAWNKGRFLTEEHKAALRVPKSVPSWSKDKELRSDLPTSEIIRLYLDEGLSCASIASRFNTNRSTVSWRLRKAGVKMRPVGFQKLVNSKESKR
jgi:group I intron endonuclease